MTHRGAGVPPARWLRSRAAVLGAVRRWFDDHGYLEVPTPSVVPSPALEENLHALSAAGAWLRTSPEFALKGAVAAGLHRVYEIGPCWRDREDGPWHLREFTMVEWYRAGADLADLQADVEDLVAAAARAVGRPEPRFERTTVRDLVWEHAGVDLATASAADLSDRDEGWDDAFFRCWVERVEPRLAGALFVDDWPATQAALAEVRDDGDWPVARRFEVFVDGVELGNAFQELLDPAELRRRFLSSAAHRRAAGDEPHPVDEGVIAATARMPKTAGIAMGLDRLVAVLMGLPGIPR